MEPKELYSFDDGAVRLIYHSAEKKYDILINGEPQHSVMTVEQSCNPLIAVNRFTDAVRWHLKSKAKRYLRASGGNPVTGCTQASDNCKHCPMFGQAPAGSRCIIDEGCGRE